MAVHHARKASAQDPVDEISGTTGLSGMADKLLVLRRDRTDRTLAYMHVGGRVGEQRDIALRWSDETHRFTVEGDTDDYRRADS